MSDLGQSSAGVALYRGRSIPRFDFWPFLCFAAVVVLPVNRLLEGILGTAWTVLIVGIFVSAALLHVSAKPTRGGVWAFASAVAIIGVISSSSSTNNQGQHWAVGVQLIVLLVFGAPAARGVFRRSPKSIRACAAAMLIGQSISAMAAIGQVVGIHVGGFGPVDGRSPGLAGHPNILGMISGVAIILCVYAIVKKFRPRLSLILVGLLNTGSLIASGSISSLISTAVGVLVLLITMRVKLRIPLGIAGGAALLLYAVSQLNESTRTIRNPLDRILQVTGQTQAVGTWDLRNLTYKFAWERILRDPFYGAGLDDASGATFDNTTVTHNVLLRSWFQGGLGLGLAFTTLYVMFAIMIILAMIHGMNALPAGLMTVVVAFSLTSAALQQEYFWMLLAGTWALVEPRLSKRW